MAGEKKKKRSMVLGRVAEEQARRFLEELGYTVLRRNFRFRSLVSEGSGTREKRGGEIDLIVRKASAIVFVEVKFRTSNEYGTVLEQVRGSQKKRIIGLAEVFIDQYPELCRGVDEFRFDCIALTPQKKSKVKKEGSSNMNEIFQLEHVENAFEVSGFS